MNYSPLRYPGGKAKLAPYIRHIIETSEDEIDTYIEPFAGGAGVALDLLFSNTVKRIIVNDYDKAIYSFWRAVIEDSEELINRILETKVTIEEWYRQKNIYTNNTKKYSIDLAFATFFLNRTNRSGILNAGPIGGRNQKGNYLIDARYNKEDLIRRIETIAKHKKYIRVYNKEVRSFIDQIIVGHHKNAFVYFDPPYFEKGKRLYKNSLTLGDHKAIAKDIKEKVVCDWVITYDNVVAIKEIYKENFFMTYEFQYSITSSNIKKEIIIFKDKQLCPRANSSDIKINFTE